MVGGNNVGFSIVYPVKETIQQITTKEGIQLNNIRVRTVFEDNTGLIWLGGFNGLLGTIDLEKMAFKSLVVDPKNTLDTNIGIFEDINNKIWLASSTTGIQKIDPETNIRIRITTDNGLISDMVYYLYPEGQNSFWAVTQRGVELINSTNKQITTFTTEEGLAANDVYDVSKHKGEVFLGTSKGFTILKQEYKGTDKAFWKVKSIGKKQGINEPDISQNSTTFDKNGRLWAGGAGLQLIVMDEVKEDTSAYPTVITGINIMDKPRVFMM